MPSGGGGPVNNLALGHEEIRIWVCAMEDFTGDNQHLDKWVNWGVSITTPAAIFWAQLQN